MPHVYYRPNTMEIRSNMRGRILAVDDQPDELELVDSILRDEGFVTETAGDGIEALQKLQRYRPDLIVVDASMPRMNGFTFCETLRRNPATATIPVIMLTGLRSHFDRLNAFAHGANVYLTKPFAVEELVAKVNELLQLSQPL